MTIRGPPEPENWVLGMAMKAWESNSGQVTYYFRKEFTVSNSRDVSSLSVDLLRDDGAVVYLNGIEVARSNLPSPSNYLTLAATTVGEEEESKYLRYEIDPLALIDGTNVLAVEVQPIFVNEQ